MAEEPENTPADEAPAEGPSASAAPPEDQAAAETPPDASAADADASPAAPAAEPAQALSTKERRQRQRDARARIIDSVSNGKRNMPPWDDVLSGDDIAALWAYVSAGEPGD